MLTSTAIAHGRIPALPLTFRIGDTKIYIVRNCKVLDVRVNYTDERHVFIYDG